MIEFHKFKEYFFAWLEVPPDDSAFHILEQFK